MQVSRGQWFVCRYNCKKNSDLVVGVVTGVRRRNGIREVIFAVPFSDESVTKYLDVVLVINKRISKRDVDKVIQFWNGLRKSGEPEDHVYEKVRAMACEVQEYVSQV